MNKEEIIEELKAFKLRLEGDVSSAYLNRGEDYGRHRFAAWRRQISKFLEESLPGSRAGLDKALNRNVFYRSEYESDHDVFVREKGAPSVAFIDSLCLDVESDEYDLTAEKEEKITPIAIENPTIKNDKVFIVHGHDEALKYKAARFVEKLGLKAIILHEQASKGHTIIEKIEANTDVGYAIVLYTPDDAGNSRKEADSGNLNQRARQNVIFEHGYLIGKLSRSRVVPLVSGRVEIPSDISGVVYAEDTNWQIDIAKEMKAAGYDIDFNKIIDDH